MKDAFDYIVVGSGPAGSALAHRLSELSDARILILEAGGGDLPPAVNVPHRWNELLLTDVDWAYNSVPQTGLKERRIYSAAGKATGGGSALYHMTHLRARAADLDNWAYGGCSGWSFNDCLPYFQKLENQRDDTNPSAGKSGPLTIVSARETGNAISQTFLDACSEHGFPLVEDFNATPFGAGWHHLNLENGSRGGALTAYLRPALAQSNVTLRTLAQASRLLIEKQRCVGVEYWSSDERHEVRAEREVVVCCGAIQTPKLLLLSGIGDADLLRRLGIKPLVHLPGVGQNLQDHPLVIGPIGTLVERFPEPRANLAEVALYLPSETGRLVPDLELTLLHRAPFGPAFPSHALRQLQGEEPVAAPDLLDPHLVMILPRLLQPLSRGWVRLADNDPRTPPDINANYCGEPADLKRLLLMVQLGREIYASKAFQKRRLTELTPGPGIGQGADLRDWVVDHTGSGHDFAGSCKMGIDRASVVDPQLKVHGVEGLRIADGSIMPTIPAAGTHATILMIGERAADFIKQPSSRSAG